MRLSLDELEAERAEREPFEVELGDGTVATLKHPEDMPFDALIGINAESPAEALSAVMGKETFEQFASNPRVTLGIMAAVLQKYSDHFGLGDLGEGAGSPGSSTGTPGRSKRASQRSTRTRATA